jgi:mRNA interferase MazF
VARQYVPDAGDIVWLNFTPHAGREQAGHRPALVLSPAAYNNKTSLMLCCPMTTQIKSYPFEVPIAAAVPSVVLSDQIKSVDWRVRKAKRKGKVSAEELADVRAKIRALIG